MFCRRQRAGHDHRLGAWRGDRGGARDPRPLPVVRGREPDRDGDRRVRAAPPTVRRTPDRGLSRATRQPPVAPAPPRSAYTSRVASRPRTSTVRRSSPVASSEACSAAATRDEEFAGTCQRRESRRRVHRVAERGEVRDLLARPERPDVRHAGVHAPADRDRPACRRIGPCRRLDEPATAVDRFPGMVPTRVARDVQADGLVAHELVDDAVRLDDGICREPVERGQQRRERRRPEPLAEAGRASDVDEQHRDLDLGAADALLGEGLHAVLAQLWVALPRPEPWLEHRAARRHETARSRACSAVGDGRRPKPRRRRRALRSMLAGEDGSRHSLLGRLLFGPRTGVYRGRQVGTLTVT